MIMEPVLLEQKRFYLYTSFSTCRSTARMQIMIKTEHTIDLGTTSIFGYFITLGMMGVILLLNLVCS